MGWTFPTEPIDISARISYGTSWADVDLGANNDVPAGTKGVWIRVRNTSATTPYKSLSRPNGSSEDRSAYGALLLQNRKDLFAKLDSGRIFDGYFENAALQVSVIAYTDSDHLFSNSVNKTPTIDGTYYDVDVSGDGVPAGAGGALCEMYRVYGNNWAVRPNGTSYDYYSGSGGTIVGICVGLDANLIFEAKLVSANSKIYLWGYLSHLYNYLATPLTKTPETTGSWQTINVAGVGEVPAGALGVILQVVGATTGRHVNFRKKGASENITTNCYVGNAAQIITVCGLDNNREFEVYLSGAGPAVYVLGYYLPGIKTFGNLAKASVKTVGGLALANVKTYGGQPQ